MVLVILESCGGRGCKNMNILTQAKAKARVKVLFSRQPMITVRWIVQNLYFMNKTWYEVHQPNISNFSIHLHFTKIDWIFVKKMHTNIFTSLWHWMKLKVIKLAKTRVHAQLFHIHHVYMTSLQLSPLHSHNQKSQKKSGRILPLYNRITIQCLAYLQPCGLE